MTIILIAVLGGIGAATRFVVDGQIRRTWTTEFPVGTITVNVTGSLLVGFLAGAVVAGSFGGSNLDAAIIGFCGGYTTFSTAMVETVRLVQAGDHRKAMLNALGTGVLTVVAVAAGFALAGLAF